VFQCFPRRALPSTPNKPALSLCTQSHLQTTETQNKAHSLLRSFVVIFVFRPFSKTCIMREEFNSKRARRAELLKPSLLHRAVAMAYCCYCQNCRFCRRWTYRMYHLKLRTSAMLVRRSISREFAVFAVTLCQIFCVWLLVGCCLLRAKYRLRAAAVVFCVVTMLSDRTGPTALHNLWPWIKWHCVTSASNSRGGFFYWFYAVKKHSTVSKFVNLDVRDSDFPWLVLTNQDGITWLASRFTSPPSVVQITHSSAQSLT
jgi:hypothetical protein